MKKIFALTILYILSCSMALAQTTFAERFVPQWERQMQFTMEVIELMPAEAFDYRPHEDMKSFYDQIVHLIENFGFLQTYISHNKKSKLSELDLKDLSKEELTQHLQTAFEYIKNLAQNTSEKDLASKVDFFAPDVDMDKMGVFHLIKNHLTHHRGELVVYLRMQGIKPPRFVGW